MGPNHQENKILNQLKKKFISLFQLINRIRSLDELVIYINMEKSKFISLLKDSNREIEEDELRELLKFYPYSVEKNQGDFIVIVAYKGETNPQTKEEVEGICHDFMRFILEEAVELQQRVLEENRVMELLEKSRLDGLTGLYNRCAFDKLYKEVYDRAKTENRDFSVLMIDLDNFKQVNDSYGHQMGDKILMKVSEKIKLNVRKNDIVARYGGEEIIIVLVDIDEVESLVIAERIRDSIATLKTEGVRVTISIGISNFKKDAARDGNMLIDIADKRLYEAKEQGKNKVRGKKKGK